MINTGKDMEGSGRNLTEIAGYLSGGTEENDEKPVSQPRFEQSTFPVQV
jgi:hypothetical protein